MYILYVVFNFNHDTTTSVTIEHFPRNEVVVASFYWAIAQPKDTYIINATPNVSLEFDRHFPVRLASITLRDVTNNASLSTLERLTGEVLVASLQHAPHVGFSVIRTSLELHHRLAIARIQAESIATPDLLRRACNGMLQALLLPGRTAPISYGVGGVA